MLKGIPSILSPELLKVLMEMGHGDEIVISDGNFPAASNANILIRADGHGIPELLDAILQLLPLDPYVEKPVTLMEVVPDDDYDPVIWKEYEKIIKKYNKSIDFMYVDRFGFYEKARKAYAIVATGEEALYANIVLKKGVIING